MYAKVRREDYCQFLLVSQTNYTLTYYADHAEGLSHDAATRYLRRDRVRPSEVWERAQGQIVLSPNGYLAFDDVVLDKNHSREIEMVYKQYSGNEHRVIRGIGLVNCIYVNPELKEFWEIDYRIYDPANDGLDKHQHVQEMLTDCFIRCTRGELEFRGVLMDQWYATIKLMLQIHRAHKVFYCPIKPNRAVSEVAPKVEKYTYQQAQTLSWTQEEEEFGKTIHLRDFPQGIEVKLFRVAISTDSTELIVTNDGGPLEVEAVRQAHGFRWKVEQFHREIKQTTGIESCQCRTARAQRNHIGCALLVWQRLKTLAKQAFTTVYALKQGLLDDYMRHQLRSPSITFA